MISSPPDVLSRTFGEVAVVLVGNSEYGLIQTPGTGFELVLDN
jgi:hypothetical protein